MKFTDYKFWYIKRDDDGYIIDCGVRFYEGDISTKGYIRTSKLSKIKMKHLGKRFVKDVGGKSVKYYDQSDFGKIKIDDELRLFLNKELNKDKTRKPIKQERNEDYTREN